MDDVTLYLLVGLIGGAVVGYPAGRKLTLLGFSILTGVLLLICWLIFSSPSGGGAWDGIAMAGLLAFLILPFLLTYFIAALFGAIKRKSDT